MIVVIKEFEKEIGRLTLTNGKVTQDDINLTEVRDPYTNETFTPEDGERFLVAVLRSYRNPYTMATTEDEALLEKARAVPAQG